MRIAIFSDTFLPQLNGVATTVYQSAKSLAQRGHKVMIFTVSKNFFAKQLGNSDIKNLQIISLPSVPALVYSKERFHIPFSATYFRLKKFAPDVIHVHTPFGSGWMGVQGSKKLGVPLVGTHHTFYDDYLKHVKMDYGWGKKLSWKATAAFYNKCDLVLSPTKFLAEMLVKNGLKKPVDLLQNSIDMNLFKPAASLTEKENLKKNRGIREQAIIFEGRLSYEKSIDQVVRAFSLMLKKRPGLKLILAGDGPEKSNLEKLAENLKIKDDVIFTGFIPYGKKVVETYQANDIFITASKSENMPVSILEAMGCGLPLVAVREKGLSELVQDNVNGFFARTDDPQDLAEKTLDLLSDAELLKKFGENSRKMALEYSEETVTAKLEEAYEKVINQPNKKTMRVCLYLEFYHFLGGFLYKNIGTGLLSSYRNQRKSLQALGLDFTEKWDANCNILQINTPWLRSLWIIRKARKRGQKIIIWAHVTAEDAMNVFWFNKYFFGLIKKYLTFAYGQADLVFCPSAHTKLLLKNYGLDENKLMVQSNGVDLSLFYKDDRARETARVQHNLNGLIVGTVGLVIPRKGVDIFIQLAKKNPRNNFIWFGKIYSQTMVKALPKVLPENVKFTGFVPDSELNADFNALDVFVFLSSEENQGMVILEAAAIGLPILLRDLPAYRGWMVHNENCLIAKNDEEVEKYLAMLMQDAQLRERLSASAKILAQKESITSLNKNLLETYQKLLQK